MTELERYLAANPGMTTRDYKGKGFNEFAPFEKDFVRPNEEPWQSLDREEVRRQATSGKARYLPRNVRQAASRDPGLEWDAQALAYRLRSVAPYGLSPGREAGNAGEGGKKVEGHSRTRPAAGRDENSMTVSPRIFDHD